MKYLFSLVAVGALLLSVSLSASAQTEVSLLVPNPFRGSVDKLIPSFESKTGYKVTVTHGKGLGTRDQVARGENFDVSILLPPCWSTTPGWRALSHSRNIGTGPRGSPSSGEFLLG